MVYNLNKINYIYIVFQNILESIKDETVKRDLLNGENGAVELTDYEISRLSQFSKMVSSKRTVEEGKPLFEVTFIKLLNTYLLVFYKPSHF